MGPKSPQSYSAGVPGNPSVGQLGGGAIRGAPVPVSVLQVVNGPIIPQMNYNSPAQLASLINQAGNHLTGGAQHSAPITSPMQMGAAVAAGAPRGVKKGSQSRATITAAVIAASSGQGVDGSAIPGELQPTVGVSGPSAGGDAVEGASGAVTPVVKKKRTPFSGPEDELLIELCVDLKPFAKKHGDVEAGWREVCDKLEEQFRVPRSTRTVKERLLVHFREGAIESKQPPEIQLKIHELRARLLIACQMANEGKDEVGNPLAQPRMGKLRKMPDIADDGDDGDVEGPAKKKSRLTKSEPGEDGEVRGSCTHTLHCPTLTMRDDVETFVCRCCIVSHTLSLFVSRSLFLALV